MTPVHMAMNSLRSVDSFARAMLSHHTLDDLLWNIAELVGELLGFDDCVIYIREGDLLVQAAACGLKNPAARDIDNPLIIPIGEGIVGAAAQTGEPQYVPNTRHDPRYISDRVEGMSELAVPVLFEGRVIGVFDSECDATDGYGAHERAQFQLIANMAATRIAWLRSERSRLASIQQQDTERLHALGLLAGGISHDFNNLLATLAMQTELARRATTPQELEPALATIDEVVERSRGLTKQLGAFAQGGAPVRETLSIEPLIHAAVRDLRSHPGISVSVQTAPILPLLNADKTQVEQVLQNLLLNAAGAMQGRGTIRINVRQTLNGSDCRLIVEVEDQGPTIDPATLKRIFDPFFSSGGTRSGLGLATSFWIVSRHGGTLTATPREHAGTRFSVELPALHGTLARSPNPDEPHLPSLHILILEDDRLVGRALRNLLIANGHQADIVEDGAEVRPKWIAARQADERYDLAILDIQNAIGMGGLEALDQLKKCDPDARAMVMSGYTESEAMQRFRAMGFRTRLEKPFDSAKLDRALRVTMGFVADVP